MPSDKLRELELQANAAFDTYRELYFEGGVSSVYLWDLDQGFAGVVLIKKGEARLQGKEGRKRRNGRGLLVACGGVASPLCLPHTHIHPTPFLPHSGRRVQEDQGLLGLDPRL